MQPAAQSRRGDFLGIGLSTICLVHCVLLGPLLALLPLIGLNAPPRWIGNAEWFHAALLVPVFLISGPILLRGSPARPLIGVIAVTGFAAMGGALLIDNETGELATTVAGSLLIVLAHVLNLHRPAAH